MMRSMCYPSLLGLSNHIISYFEDPYTNMYILYIIYKSTSRLEKDQVVFVFFHFVQSSESDQVSAV